MYHTHRDDLLRTPTSMTQDTHLWPVICSDGLREGGKNAQRSFKHILRSNRSVSHAAYSGLYALDYPAVIKHCNGNSLSLVGSSGVFQCQV